MQPGAQGYEVIRSTTPDFSDDCTTFTGPRPFTVDEAQPTEGQVFYYLDVGARSLYTAANRDEVDSVVRGLLGE